MESNERINTFGYIAKESLIAVGATRVQIVGVDSARVFFSVTNNTTGLCYLSTRSDQIVPRGIPITGNGGVYEITYSRFGGIVGLEWYVVSAIGAGNLWICEISYRP